MNKGAGQLDQGLVKIAIGFEPHLQPEILEDLVRLIKLLMIEAVEIAQVARIQVPALEGFDEAGDAGAFMTHPGIIPGPG